MAQTIQNQASLNFQYNGQTGTAVSNIATAVLQDPLSISKNSVSDTYRAGGEITYALSVTNSGSTSLSNVTVVDDLGTYTVGSTSVTPLTFVSPAILYVDGVYSGTLTPTIETDKITFLIPTLGAGANAIIIYNVSVNDGALLESGSVITNTASVTADGISAPATDENTVTVEDYAAVEITKSMTPSAVVDDSTITYNFTIYNYGNTEATDIVLTDNFNPAPTNITVTVDGEIVDPSDYTYENNTLTLPTGTDLSLSLPAATSTQNPVTGEVTITPSTLNITVTGTL